MSAVSEIPGVAKLLHPMTGKAPGVFLMTDTLETGGSERQFALLSNALRGGAFRIELGCLGKHGPFLNQVQPIHEFSPAGSFLSWQAQRQRLALARYLRKTNIEVAHSFDFYSNLMLVPMARVAGVQVVVASHRQIGDLLRPRQFKVQSATFRLSHRVVCNSHAAATRLRETGTPQWKLVVIPNALPDDCFTKKVPLLPHQPGRFRIGMVARMSDVSKNHALFLRVVSKVASRHQHVDFVLAGDGHLRPCLQKTAQDLGIGARVQFLGDCRDIGGLLASLDVSVLTSRSESLSNAILEAMAAGVPTVACDVGGNSELLRSGENGFLVPNDDENAFTVVIERLINDQALQRAIGEQARTEAHNRYSLPRIRRLYEQLYSDLLSERAKATRK